MQLVKKGMRLSKIEQSCAGKLVQSGNDAAM